MKITGTFVSLLLSLAAAQEVRLDLNATDITTESQDGSDSDMKPQILGGTELPVGTKLYTTGLRATPDGTTFCGGSLITSKHVLTAAHCYDYIRYVSVGTHYVSGAEDGQQIRVVKKTMHPKRTSSNPTSGQSWDLLVLELEEPVQNVEPVTLAKADGSDTVVGDMASVIGWGTTSEGGYQSDVLLSVDVKLRSNAQCSKRSSLIDESMLCAGGRSNQDACQGDSGGPLVVDKNGLDVLVGVVSFGHGCGRKGMPGVYARVSKARDWLDKVAPGAQWR